MDLNAWGDLLLLIAPVLSAGATYALTAAGLYFGNKYRNNQLIQALLILDKIVIEVVKELNQTVVGDLKKAKADGKLSRSEAEAIKRRAVDLVLSRVGKGLVRLIQSVTGPVADLVSTKIEATIYDLKKDHRNSSLPIRGHLQSVA